MSSFLGSFVRDSETHLLPPSSSPSPYPSLSPSDTSKCSTSTANISVVGATREIYRPRDSSECSTDINFNNNSFDRISEKRKVYREYVASLVQVAYTMYDMIWFYWFVVL